MLGRKLVQIGQVARRNIATSAPRLHGYEATDCIGANLPFSIENPWTLPIKMGLFFGSGFSIPFLLVRFQLKAASGQQ